MFFEILAKMRQKPEYVRYQIALWGSVLITGCIAGVFILTQLANGILGSVSGDAGGNAAEEAARVRGAVPLTKPDNIFQTENVFNADVYVGEPAMEQHAHTDTHGTTTLHVPTNAAGEEQVSEIQQTGTSTEVHRESE
jgi:hypothetical protein